jgi:hypothetical protein
MARVLIAAQTLPGPYPALPVTPGSDLAMQAGDVGLGNYTPLVDGKTVVLVQNTDSGARTVTFASVADAPFSRKGDISAYSLAAGKIRPFGPFKSAGWAQAGAQLWIDVSDATVKVAVITLP